jgi:hypothetical protein
MSPKNLGIGHFGGAAAGSIPNGGLFGEAKIAGKPVGPESADVFAAYLGNGGPVNPVNMLVEAGAGVTHGGRVGKLEDYKNPDVVIVKGTGAPQMFPT